MFFSEQQATRNYANIYSMHSLIRVAACAHLCRDKSTHALTPATSFHFLFVQTAAAETLSTNLPLRQELFRWPSALVAHEQQNIEEMDRIVKHSSHTPSMSCLFFESQARLLQASAKGLQCFGHLPSAYMLMCSAANMQSSFQDPNQATNVLCDLAELCKIIDRQQDEEDVPQRAVQSSKNPMVPLHLKAFAHANLAVYLSNQGKPSEAVPLLRVALAALIDAGNRSGGVQSVLQHLESVVHDMGELEEAEAVLREALDMCGKSLGGEHVRTGYSLHTLASMLYTAGRH